MDKKEKILVVEDEADIRELIQIYLHRYGYKTVIASDGREAIEKFEMEQPDLILLDILLPHMDGIEVCRKIREYSNIPIVFMSCRKDAEDVIKGLEIGGDDYVTKPFDPGVLVARVLANLRRAPIFNRAKLLKLTNEKKEVLKYKDLEINLRNLEVRVKGELIILSSKELNLLLLLTEYPDKVFTPQELYKKIWGLDCLGDTRTVAVHLSTLRKKIESNPTVPVYIKNIRGVGYKFIGAGEKEEPI